MSESKRCGGELDTAAGIRPLRAIGSAFAVFMCAVFMCAVVMCAVVTFAAIVMLGNNTPRCCHVPAVDKVLAIAGKGVGDRDQCPDDHQNTS